MKTPNATLPKSISDEFDRSRRVIEDVLSSKTSEHLVELISKLSLEGVDTTLLCAVVRRFVYLVHRLNGPGGPDAWLNAVQDVIQKAPHCTNAFLQSSEEVLRYGSPAELLLWTRLGLRHGHIPRVGESGTLLAHFELRSRESTLVIKGDGENVDLATNKLRLSYLIRTLFDLGTPLLSVEQGISTRRPFISNLGLHLPEAGRALRGSIAKCWYDSAAAHAAAHIIYSTQKYERGTLKPIQMALVGVLEDARVELLAINDLPGLRRLWLTHHVVSPEHGQTFIVLMLRLARSLLDPDYEDPHPWVTKGRNLFFDVTEGGNTPHLMTSDLLRDIASKLGNDIGQMRLQFNYREYVVEPPYRDDNAHIWIEEEETKAEFVATTDQLRLPPDNAEAQEVRPCDEERLFEIDRFKYPEWDRLIEAYRQEWATILEKRPPEADAQSLMRVVQNHSTLLQHLQRVLRAGRLRERMTLREQIRGDELDLDAVVRSQIERRLHHSPGEKVHKRQSRRERDAAALILIDSSESTADMVESGGTVIQLAQSAGLLTAMTLNDAGDHFGIDAFCSNGRHEVSYEIAVDFGDPLDNAAIARLAGITSRWSTRMGTALRHATRRLAERQQRRRLLLVITDGEPHDIDIHDRRYLMEDARRAVREAARLGVTVFCIALDSNADNYVKYIFGERNYRVLDRVEGLTSILPTVVTRMMH